MQKLNLARGDVVFRFGLEPAEAMVLTTEWPGVAWLEAECGRSLGAFYRDLVATGKPSLADIILVIRAGLHTGEETWPVDDVGPLVVRAGVLTAWEVASQWMANVMTGGMEAGELGSGEVEAAAEAVNTLSAAFSGLQQARSDGRLARSGDQHRMNSSPRSKPEHPKE